MQNLLGLHGMSKIVIQNPPKAKERNKYKPRASTTNQK
jgi:hypothetical protein